MLVKSSSNLIDHPEKDAFKRIKMSNASAKWLTDVTGGKACLLSLGFTETYEGEAAWVASSDSVERVIDGKELFEAKLSYLSKQTYTPLDIGDMDQDETLAILMSLENPQDRMPAGWPLPFPRVPRHGGNAKEGVPVTKWAMTMEQLHQFINACKQSAMWQKIKETKDKWGKIGHVNGYDLNENWVKPWTRGTGCSVSLLMNEEPKEAEIMFSHAWKEDIEECQEAVLELLQKKSNRGQEITWKTGIWFCIFANYQPGDGKGPSIPDQIAMEPFKNVILSPSTMMMGVIHTSTAEVYERKWCAYEIFVAVKERGYEFVVGVFSGKYFADVQAPTSEVLDKWLAGEGQKEEKEGWFISEEKIKVNTKEAKCGEGDEGRQDEIMIDEKIKKEWKRGFDEVDEIVERKRKEELMAFWKKKEKEQLMAYENKGEKPKFSITAFLGADFSEEDFRQKLGPFIESATPMVKELLGPDPDLAKFWGDRLDALSKFLAGTALPDQTTAKMTKELIMGIEDVVKTIEEMPEREEAREEMIKEHMKRFGPNNEEVLKIWIMQFGDEGNHEMIEALHHGLGGYRETIETVVTQVRHQVTEEMVKTLSDRFGNGHVDQLNMQLIIQFRNKQNESMLDFLVNHYGSDERRKIIEALISRFGNEHKVLIQDMVMEFGNRKKEDMSHQIKQKLFSLPPHPSALLNDPDALEALLHNPEELKRVLQDPGVERWLKANPLFLEKVLQRQDALAILYSHPEIKQKVEEILGRRI